MAITFSSPHVLDFTIWANRPPQPSSYHPTMREILHPELECVGPAVYDLFTDVEHWSHKDQTMGSTRGYEIYEYQLSTGGLIDCFSLADLLAIQAKDIRVYRYLFAGKVLSAWKSVFRVGQILKRVPVLLEYGEKLVLDWEFLDALFDEGDVTPRFKSAGLYW